MSSPQALAREPARADTARDIDISAHSLPQAIDELAREAGVSIGTRGALPRVGSPRVHGHMTIGEALARLLSGTGLAARPVSASAWRIEPAPRRAAAPSSTADTRPAEQFGSPIVVTATKQPLALSMLPAAISVVQPSGLVPNDAGQASGEIAAHMEGLSLTSLGAGRNRMFLRGVADSAFGGESQTTVAVVLDEARVTYAAPDPDLRLVDMRQVEVLKGPQGSLYGTGALGGIYRMVTNPADLYETSLSVSGAGSLAERGGVGGDGSVVANVPLARGVVALRGVAYAAEGPGWVDTGTRENANSTRILGARLALGVEPGSGWRIDLSAVGQWIESDDTAYTYTPHSYVRPAQVAEPHDNDFRHVALRAQGALGGVDVMAASAVTWHDVNDAFDAAVGAEDFGIVDPVRLIDLRTYRIWDSELRLRGQVGAVSWLAGLSRIDARHWIKTRLEDASGETLPLHIDDRDSHDTAAYFDVTVPLTSTLSLDGGARLFRASISETLMGTGGSVTYEKDKSGMTPSLALAWQPTAHRLLYLRYGSAFRQGAAELSMDGPSEQLRSDELASLEAGWRERLPGGGMLELGAWYSRWENVQSDALGSDGLIETVNAGNARILGLEGSLDWRIAGGWRLEAGGNFTDARLVRSALGYDIDDARLPVVPDFTVRAAVRRDFNLGALDGWVRLDLRYVGAARMSFDPELDRRIGNRIETGLELHAAEGPWRFGLGLSNLLRRRANTFGYGNPLRYPSMAQYTAQAPLTVRISASLDL